MSSSVAIIKFKNKFLASIEEKKTKEENKAHLGQCKHCMEWSYMKSITINKGIWDWKLK